MKLPKYFYGILLIIPIFYTLLSSYFHENIGLFSVRSADPEYIYYICGIEVANGQMAVSNIDHPGNTLHYFLAATFRITHWIRGNNIPFNEDILANPDLYLRVSNSVINFCLGIFLFLIGYLSLLIVPNIWYALIIQFTPFATDISYSNMGRITPESIMSFFLILISVFALRILFDKNKPDAWKTVILFAGIFAVTLALKLTLAFLLIIPLILISSWKKKIYFAGLTLFFFLVFALPVTLQLGYFWGWIKKILLYSGQYGGGEKNIVEISTFFPNIINLYHLNKSFFLFTFLFFIVFVYSYFFKKKESKGIANKMSLALGLIVLLQVIILGKQFKTSYFIPALMLLPLIVILTLEHLKTWLSGRYFRYLPAVLVSLVIILFLKDQRPIIRELSASLENQNIEKMKAYRFLKSVKENSILIMAVGSYGGPSEEYALMTSNEWAGKYKSYYRPTFAKLYPDTYMYFTWDKTLKYWGNPLYLKTIINSNKPVYMYLENDAPELYQKTLEKFEFTKDSCKVDSTLLFENKNTKELIYRLNFYARNGDVIKAE
jgi:hypothetical protein